MSATERDELLRMLEQYGVEDLRVALKAAQASRQTRDGDSYFLHHFLGQSRDFSLTADEQGASGSKVSIPISPLWMNQVGMVHGGVTALLCDNAMGMASYLHAQKPGVTLEMSVRYHMPGRGEMLTAEGYVVHAGSQLNSTRSEVRDNLGNLVASATGTFYHRKLEGF